MKRTSAILTFCLLSTAVFASGVAETADSLKTFRDYPIANIKFNLTTPLDPLRSSVMLASDIFISRHLGVELSAGSYFANWFFSYKGENLFGVKGRIAFKYFLEESDGTIPYVGLLGKINHYYRRGISDVCRVGCQYIERMYIRKRFLTAGVSVIAGALFYLNDKRNIIVDVYGGLGYKATIIDFRLPDDARIIRNRMDALWGTRGPGLYHLPDALLGINIGYTFYPRAMRRSRKATFSNDF
ncbi:MAG: hypothetical protein NZM35_05050 [Chitinophagales bacterium]|nr:hypothetical protein [Chitinophagales bacterium]MDW8418590.1 hypothetical protein [Chitinophagales bacterium]